VQGIRGRRKRGVFGREQRRRRNHAQPITAESQQQLFKPRPLCSEISGLHPKGAELGSWEHRRAKTVPTQKPGTFSNLWANMSCK